MLDSARGLPRVFEAGFQSEWGMYFLFKHQGEIEEMISRLDPQNGRPVDQSEERARHRSIKRRRRLESGVWSAKPSDFTTCFGVCPVSHSLEPARA